MIEVFVLLICFSLPSIMEPAKKRLRCHPERKRSIGRKRNIIFKGNQFKPPPATIKLENAKLRSETEEQTYKKSASTKKIKNSSLDDVEKSSAQYRLVDFSLLLPFLENNVYCKCGYQLKFSESETRGLGFMIDMECKNHKCSIATSVSSCKKIGEKKNLYEVNRRSVVAI